ncbi:MAG: tetratricopeptide repeat protein [Acidimicrobiales bacterium]
MIDVTDATFETEVLDRSTQVPVVVDLWAPWCGPCKTLGPIIERAVDATNGKVVLAKVNTDENPGVARAFQVQSIPAVYALKDRKVVDGFIGAQPERTVTEWVSRLLPTEEENEVSALVAKGDETSLRQALELDPDNEEVIVALAKLCVENGNPDEALELIGRIPESPATRHVAALARAGGDFTATGDIEAKLDALLDKVKGDDEARQEFVDLLELLGPDDPRTPAYRKKLTARLY